MDEDDTEAQKTALVLGRVPKLQMRAPEMYCASTTAHVDCTVQTCPLWIKSGR